jgi:hypothetical protein
MQAGRGAAGRHPGTLCCSHREASAQSVTAELSGFPAGVMLVTRGSGAGAPDSDAARSVLAITGNSGLLMITESWGVIPFLTTSPHSHFNVQSMAP